MAKEIRAKDYKSDIEQGLSMVKDKLLHPERYAKRLCKRL